MKFAKNHSFLGLIAAAAAMSVMPAPSRRTLLVDDSGSPLPPTPRDDSDIIEKARIRREAKVAKRAANLHKSIVNSYKTLPHEIDPSQPSGV